MSPDSVRFCVIHHLSRSVPSSYIHSLECFISAKQEYLSQDTSSSSRNLSAVYDYQHKYVTGLVKQLPPGTVFPATSRFIPIHPPSTIKARPLRQGPFLLQPSPRSLEGSEATDATSATDITYLAFGTDDDEPEDDARDTEHLGIVLVTYQDGKVDLFLDVEKVEARWDTKQVYLPSFGRFSLVLIHLETSSRDLPMLAVYETIDLALLSTLNQVTPISGSKHLRELLHANHPVFLLDPLHDDMIYVYHAFGVHALDISPVLRGLAAALRGDEDDTKLKSKLEEPTMTNVRPILDTFSVERGSDNPFLILDIWLIYATGPQIL